MTKSLIALVSEAWKKTCWPVFGLVVAVNLLQTLAAAQDVKQAASQIAAKPVPTESQKNNIPRNYLLQPFGFEPNQGQTDKRVQFLSKGRG
jgi:hypothetical protein